MQGSTALLPWRVPERCCYHLPPMIRFFLLFLLLLAGLFTLEILAPVQHYVVMPFTSLLADISAAVMQFFDSQVIASGQVIRSATSGFAVQIAPGCNGVEAVIVLFAAIFAFPAPMKHKAVGFLVGFFAIQILNLVRIISLFYLGQWDRTAFEWAHLYLWQALIILDALMVWLIWLRYLPRRPRGEPAA